MQQSSAQAKNAATFRKKKARKISLNVDKRTYKTIENKLESVMNQKNISTENIVNANNNNKGQEQFENQILAIGLVITIIGLTICMLALIYGK